MYVFRDELTFKRLRRLSISAATVAIVIIAVFVGVLVNLTRVFSDSYHDIIHSLVRGDSVIISHLVKADINTVNSLALFSVDGSFLDNYLILNEVIRKPNYLSIGFCSTDGKCRETNDTLGVTSFHLTEAQVQPRNAIREALAGQVQISEPYLSKFVNQQVMIIAAPVDDDRGFRTGAVFAVRPLKDYSEILRESRHNFNERLYLLNSKGYIIASSRTDDVLIEGSLFSEELIQGADEKEFLNSLADDVGPIDPHSRSTCRQYELDGPNGEVSVHAQRVDINDWTLVYALDHDVSFMVIYRDMIVLGLALFFFLAVIIGLGIYAYLNIRRSTERQQQLLSHDQLTGALNFSRFYYELQQIDFAKHSYALASFNVRDFRYINKFAGVSIGDLLLKTIANVAAALPQMCFVCRTDSDRFYLLFKASSTDEATIIVDDLIKRLQQNFSFIKLSCSLVCYSALAISEVYDTADSLIQKTQIAARYIDKKFNHTISVYDRALQLEEQRLKGHEQRMRSALENGEFKLYLQGQFDLRDQSIARAEALVRWELPDGTIIYPDQFIALFEQNGFSTELDFYMFEQACKTVRNWIDNGYEPIAISVNQTRTLLSYPNYVHRLKEILDLYEVPARYLMIEMLEGEMATHIEQLNDVVDELHKVGIRMALDDFGTGYSSLNVLAGMSLDEIKFDKQFLLVADPKEKLRNRFILKQMMRIVRMFNMSSVVEGVETAEDVDFIKEIGCDFAQGFYYSRPIPLDDFNNKFMKRK